MSISTSSTSPIAKTTDGTAISVEKGPDGTIHFSTGKNLTPEEDTAYRGFLSDNDQAILVVPTFVALFLLVKSFYALAVKGDKTGALTLFGRVFTWVCDFLGLVNSPKISKKGSPKKAGCVPAIRSTATTLDNFKSETNNTNVSSADLNQEADYLNNAWILQTMLKAGMEKVDRNTIPVAKTAVAGIRKVLEVVDPILDTHSDLASSINDALTYMKDPHKKGAKTRKANKKKTEKAVTAATANALPKARDEVRGEVTQQITDKLSGLFGTSK